MIRNFISSLITAVGIFTSSGLRAEVTPEMGKTNIVLILADDFGYGDLIHQFDMIVGRLMDTLAELGVAERTLVIVTSDNGPELPTVQHMRETYGHDGHWGAKDFALPVSAPDAPGQLYHLERDPGERDNLYFKHPEIVERLKQELERMKTSGRSTPWPRR